MAEVAATGAVEILDFKGHYGMEMPELPLLLAMYERAMELFPDALLEDAHDIPEVAELLAGRGRPDLLRRADPLRRRSRRGPAATARAEHQAVPGRRPADAARPLRRGGAAAA